MFFGGYLHVKALRKNIGEIDSMWMCLNIFCCWLNFEEDEERKRARKTVQRERDFLKVDLRGAGNGDNLRMTSGRRDLPEYILQDSKTYSLYAMIPKSFDRRTN